MSHPRSWHPCGGWASAPRRFAAPTPACHPPRYYSNPHYREMSSPSNTTPRSAVTQPCGETGHFSELPARAVRAWVGGGGGVDASGVSCEGGAAPSGCQLFLSSVLQLLLLSSPRKMQLTVYSRPAPATNSSRDFRASPALQLMLFAARHLRPCWAHSRCPLNAM